MDLSGDLTSSICTSDWPVSHLHNILKLAVAHKIAPSLAVAIRCLFRLAAIRRSKIQRRSLDNYQYVSPRFLDDYLVVSQNKGTPM